MTEPAPATGAAKCSSAIVDDTQILQWHLRYLKAAQAQAIARGAGVIVAIPDTGIAPHPDLKNNLLPGVDLTPTGGDGREDLDGHGTGMAGLVAAHGIRAGTGALGIAPDAKLMPIRGKATSAGGDVEDLAAGIEFATSHGADVISISAVSAASVRLQQAIRLALQSNIVVVAGAGNRPEDTHVGYPASEPGVIAVGGVDKNGNHAAISVTGPEIDVVAPAVDIYSTSINGGYRVGTGTSDATAIVAGAAALIRSKYPDLPAEEVAHRLTATAIDKGPPGRDDEYGYGVIDLVAALTADVPPLGFESSQVTPPASTVAESGDPGDGGATARGLATLGVLVAAGGAYLAWRRRRRAEDPPPRVSR
ncbi:type VII secretion-associated serine protease mycosin [Micromonospora auratinigra]|uniref:Type VII secretion-associated serine protease mycosin n=1 Tax=Micromonospora auratinigra TaxID=261654 RepID=A0A1A9A5V8_9ACTN|nr:type VII secretion-associated serine protease mycosin [Micromonospora auratinigra]